MSRWQKFMNLILALGLFFLVAYGIETSHAGGTPSSSADAHSDSSAEIGDIIGGDTILGGDSRKALALGFSYGMSDVDINEGRNCMGSENGANILWGKQELILMPWCAALFYDANGDHVFAAKMRCDIEGIRNKYTTLDECWTGQNLADKDGDTSSSAIDDAIDKAVGAVVAQYQEDEDDRQELVAEVQQQLEEQQAQYEELAARRSRPAPVQQSAAEAYWTDERRAALEAIKGEK